MRKKVFCIALCLFAAGAAVFAVGNRQQAASARQTLEIGMQTSPLCTDYKNNYLTQYLERRHDVELTIYEFPSSSSEVMTKIALLAASNELPETIWGSNIMSWEQILDYGTGGLLVPLNRYFSDASKTPYFNQIPLANRQAILRATTSADGNVYAFCRWRPDPNALTPFKFYINREWLTKLGLQEPKTTEELRTVLRAFVNNDPNGNGRRDEIGVFGSMTRWGANTILALINSFIYYNEALIALDETGNNVIAPFTQPAFRTALQYLNSLFREGLLDASLFTVDEAGFRAALSAEPAIVGLTTHGNDAGTYLGGTLDPNYLASIPILAPLSSPISSGYTPYVDNASQPISWVTNRAKNPDLAVKVMDSFYDLEVSTISAYGEEGVDWTRDPAVLSNLYNPYVAMGTFPRVTIGFIVDNTSAPHSKHWIVRNPTYLPPETDLTGASIASTLGGTDTTYYSNVDTLRLYSPRLPQHLLPTLQYTSAEGDTLVQVTPNIRSYVWERSTAEFIVGTRDINSDAVWNEYLRTLDSMGLQTWLRYAQTAWNRQK